ncbi:MAG: hypothetical protein LBU37_10625 [Tannerellaceae bacterium]|jgi:hypothetical protein|nr:hypothetical protein [Tannerellaceae bacterium]
MEKNQRKFGHGLIAEACRQVGVTDAVYRHAKKVQRDGGVLTRAQLAVLVKYKELLAQAEEQLKSLKD